MGVRVLWLVAVVILALPGAVAAQEESQVGLVIQFPDGRVETQCIAFEGETIAGDELLARSGLEVVIDPSSGMGVTVCQIEGDGCDFPSEHCFCQCMGGESCAYWNYFYRDPGSTGASGEAWRYSALGPAIRTAPAGGLEAWVWGNGQTPPSADLTFEAVCAPSVPTPEATETPPPTLVDTPAAVGTNTPAVPAGTASQVAVAASDTPAPQQATDTVPPPTVLAPAETRVAQINEQAETGSYWAFVLIVVSLAAVGLVVLLRQRWGRRE